MVLLEAFQLANSHYKIVVLHDPCDALAFRCKSVPLIEVPLAVASKNHLKTAFSTAAKAGARSFFLLPLTPQAAAAVTASLLLTEIVAITIAADAK